MYFSLPHYISPSPASKSESDWQGGTQVGEWKEREREREREIAVWSIFIILHSAVSQHRDHKSQPPAHFTDNETQTQLTSDLSPATDILAQTHTENDSTYCNTVWNPIIDAPTRM